MSDTTGDDGEGTTGRGARGSAASQKRQEEELKKKLDGAEELIAELGFEVGSLQSQLTEALGRERDLQSEVRDVVAKYEALLRDVVLGSALDGLSYSLERLGSKLEDQLAPLAVLKTLNTTIPVDAVDVSRFAAVQQAAARIKPDSYVIRRATTTEEAAVPPPADTASAH